MGIRDFSNRFVNVYSSFHNIHLLSSATDVRLFVINIFTRNNRKKEEFFYLTTHSTHFIYGYVASDI